MSGSSSSAAEQFLVVGSVRFRPRTAAILTSASILMLALAGSEAWLRSNPLAGVPLPHALANERDDHGYVAHSVRNYGAPGHPDITVIGTSALREGLLAAPIMERRLKEMVGVQTRFHNLSTFDQTLTEALTVAAAAPLTGATLLVLEIKPRRFAHSAAELRSAYTAPRMAMLPDDAPFELLTREGLVGRLGSPSLWRHRVWLHHFMDGRIDPGVRSLITDLVTFRCGPACLRGLATTAWLRAPRRYLAHAYPDLSLPEQRLLGLREEIVSIRVPEFVENHGLNAVAATAILDRVRDAGATVLLVDPPRHPYSLSAYSPVKNLYRDEIAALVDHGAKYLDLSQAPQIGAADFYDLDHLRPSGQATLSRLLLDAIGTQLNGAEARIHSGERGL
jgi:hypothetical protein